MKLRCLPLLLLLSAFACAGSASAGSKGPVTDDVLHDRVQIKLAGDLVVKGGGLTIDVNNGVVTLSGKVESEKQKDKAEKLSKKIDGVKSVVNQIQVAQH